MEIVALLKKEEDAIFIASSIYRCELQYD